MPQMGESIAEGTVSKWLKKPGDPVERDEAVVEISTDKVDTEVPAPAAGTLAEIVVAEGETVEVGTVVAYIERESSTPAAADGAPASDEAGSASPSPAEPAAHQPRAAGEADAAQAPEPSPPAAGAGASDAAPSGALPRASTPSSEEAVAGPDQDDRASADSPAAPSTDAGRAPLAETAEERLRRKSTPVVRIIAEQAGVDITDVAGTGHLGRVTKQDILKHIDAGRSASAPPAAPLPSAPERPPESAPSAAPAPDALWDRFHDEVRHPTFPVREGDRVETMDKMRRLTARHMVLAKRIAPHVHSFIEIDFSEVDRIRRENRAQWAAQGARVSYTAFVAWACARVLRDYPSINGTVSGASVIHRGSVNLGMAVDLNPGLIVPVIHDAGNLSLTGIAKAIVDVAERARARRLAPDEVQGGTFTITNPGVLGTIVGMPVIPKGTAAILGTGAIEKRVVVLPDPRSGEDVMAIRKRSYFSLGYDHRLVDGADSARFLAQLKALLEDFPAEA